MCQIFNHRDHCTCTPCKGMTGCSMGDYTNRCECGMCRYHNPTVKVVTEYEVEEE